MPEHRQCPRIHRPMQSCSPAEAQLVLDIGSGNNAVKRRFYIRITQPVFSRGHRSLQRTNIGPGACRQLSCPIDQGLAHRSRILLFNPGNAFIVCLSPFQNYSFTFQLPLNIAKFDLKIPRIDPGQLLAFGYFISDIDWALNLRVLPRGRTSPLPG